MVCECCQKEPAILQVAKRINRIDDSLFWLCKECLRRKFSFIQRWNIDRQDWQFLTLNQPIGG